MNERSGEFLKKKYDYLEKELVRINGGKMWPGAKSYLHYDKMLEWAIRDIEKKLEGGKK